MRESKSPFWKTVKKKKKNTEKVSQKPDVAIFTFVKKIDLFVRKCELCVCKGIQRHLSFISFYPWISQGHTI